MSESDSRPPTNPQHTEEDWLTVETAAKHIGVSTAQLLAALRRGTVEQETDPDDESLRFVTRGVAEYWRQQLSTISSPFEWLQAVLQRRKAPKFLTVEEVTALMDSVSLPTVYRWVQIGLLPRYKVSFGDDSPRMLVPEAYVKALIEYARKQERKLSIQLCRDYREACRKERKLVKG